VQIVVIEERRPERESIARALTNENWRVQALADRASAIAALRGKAPDVVVVRSDRNRKVKREKYNTFRNGNKVKEYKANLEISD